MNSYGTYSVKLRRAINADSSLPKLLVFNDSFGEVLEPFLSLHFRETVFIGSQFSSVIIEQEKPDMVIMEVVERYAPSLAWGELK